MSGPGILQRIAVQTATVGPVGRLPIAPGTWGSLAAVVIWWLLLSTLSLASYWSILLVMFILAVWVSGHAEQILGRDARPIVIDELVGQWIVLGFCPRHIWAAVAAFLLFRLFDIWKPFPVGLSQRLKGGWGVVADDILAGGYAALVIAIIQRIRLG